ncbi:MAG: RDD family protein [Thermoplasmata archaeon]|nr:RDD family protein [Thermoplasmata archaeon]
MVDPWVLSSDVISLIAASILTPALWIVLFLWAWTRPAQARESGFGRMTFWLLLPGAFLASLADAPFLPWAGNVLAINIGGALIPVLLSIVLLRREFGSSSWIATGLLMVILAAETAIQFALVVRIPANSNILLVTATAIGAVAFAIWVFPVWTLHASAKPKGTTKSGYDFAASIRRISARLSRLRFAELLRRIYTRLSSLRFSAGTLRPISLRAITFMGLVSAAITLTFATSSAVPGVGIVSVFPLYLIGPVVVGGASVVLAATLWRTAPFHGLGVAFASATLGTLIGADVLREPPLYAGGSSALLAIGGAGIQDLVYFSGLLAVGAGLLVIAVGYRESITTLADSPPTAPAPVDALRTAAERLSSGDPAGAVRTSLEASKVAVQRARSSWQLPPSSSEGAAWDELPVAPYVRNDYRNLVSAADQAVSTPREGVRAMAMASQFVRLGRDLSRLRFAPLGRRAWAMVVDLTVVTAPAVVLWSLLSRTLSGSPTAILSGLPFNLAVFAYIAYAALYFVVSDALFGATLGKVLLRLKVIDRSQARPTVLQSLLRESPKAVPLFVIGELGGPAILYLARSNSASISTRGLSVGLFTGASLLGLVIVIVILALAVGAVQVARDSERQRLGDRWASTWVVDRRVVTPAWGAMLAQPPAPSGVVQPG